LRTTGLPPSCGTSDIVISSKGFGFLPIIVEQNCCYVNEKPAPMANARPWDCRKPS
jgi:hypothetical protein